MDLHNRPNPWHVRIRLVVLVTILVMGFGLAAVERWRQDKVYDAWGRVYGVLTRFLNPVREHTRQSAMVIFKMDQLWAVEDNNKHLQRDLSQLQVKNQMLSEELGRLNRLAGLGRWSGPSDLHFLASDVIGLVTNEQSAALIINRGRLDGVRPRDPVVALGGLVGIVQTVSSHTARAQAITDLLSAVGAVDRQSRARGIVYGRGRNKPLAFMPENEIQPIEKNTTLITSGFENSVYPKGVVIGTIIDRKLDDYGLPYGVVKPAVSFEALEEVLLVLPRNRPVDDRSSTALLGRYMIAMPSSGDKDDADERTTLKVKVIPPAEDFALPILRQFAQLDTRNWLKGWSQPQPEVQVQFPPLPVENVGNRTLGPAPVPAPAVPVIKVVPTPTPPAKPKTRHTVPTPTPTPTPKTPDAPAPTNNPAWRSVPPSEVFGGNEPDASDQNSDQNSDPKPPSDSSKDSQPSRRNSDDVSPQDFSR